MFKMASLLIRYSSALKWVSLVAVTWLQTLNGTNSDFPAYSSNLKYLLSISQVQLNNLAAASDAGKLLGWVSGVAANYLPLWLVLFVGTSLGLVGYGLQYVFVVGKLPLDYWQVFMLTMFAGNSICWINTVCLMAAIQNFPTDSHRMVLGLSTSYIGLSAKMYTSVADAFLTERYAGGSYILLNSVAPIAVGVVVAPFLQCFRTNYNSIDEIESLHQGFMVMVTLAVSTGVYSVVGSIYDKILSPKIFAFGLVALLVAPLLLPSIVAVRRTIENKLKVKDGKVFDCSSDESQQSIYIENKTVAVRTENHMDEEEGLRKIVEETAIDHKDEGESGPSVIQLLRSFNFWLYFMAYLCGATLGLVFLNNLGQVAESRGYSRTSTLVSLSSSCGFFGRLMPSIIDYYSSRVKFNLPRTISMSMLMVPMVVAFFLLASSSSESALYGGTAVLGVCTGAITSISVSATPELFGTNNFGLNHNILVMNVPAGSFLFGYVASVLYDRESDSTGKCLGMQCFQKTFIMWGCICSLGVLLSLLLFLRTRK